MNFTDNTVVQALPLLLQKFDDANIPVFGSEEEQVKNGCLASEGIDYYALGVRTGELAAQILNGTPPARSRRNTSPRPSPPSTKRSPPATASPSPRTSPNAPLWSPPTPNNKPGLHKKAPVFRSFFCALSLPPRLSGGLGRRGAFLLLPHGQQDLGLKQVSVGRKAELSAHQLAQALGNRKPQARALARAGSVAPHQSAAPRRPGRQ